MKSINLGKGPSEIVVGDYAMWPVDDAEKIGITYIPTGEIGIFNKADLEPYIKGFFGLNF
jgi:hypothetical protein